MIKAFLLVLAFVYPNGRVEVHHTFVDRCPSQQEVKEMMRPLLETKEIIGFGGDCTQLSAVLRGT